MEENPIQKLYLSVQEIITQQQLWTKYSQFAWPSGHVIRLVFSTNILLKKIPSE